MKFVRKTRIKGQRSIEHLKFYSSFSDKFILVPIPFTINKYYHCFRCKGSEFFFKKLIPDES